MKRLTIEYIRKMIAMDSYILLSDHYKNAHIKLIIQCNNNHIFDMNWSDWKGGNRCPECAGNKKHKYLDVKTDIESDEGYFLISKKYKNVNSKLEIMCPNGNIFQKSYKNWKKGQRCNCLDCDTKFHIYTNDEVDNLMKINNYELLTPYNGNNKIHIKCPEGHEINMWFSNFKKGHRCKYCADINKRSWIVNGTKWFDYISNCRSLQYKNYKVYKHIINPDNLKWGKMYYHVDHIYSISDGFKNNIPYYIISSVPNLQMLFYIDNLSKGTRSDMTKKQLIKEYNQFYKEHDVLKNI